MKNVQLLLLLLVPAALAEIRLFMGENFVDCSVPGPLKSMDLSKMEYEYINDTEYYLRGELKFLREFKSPMNFALKLEKLDRGQWTSFLKRDVPDLCSRMQLPTEPWYTFFSQLSKKNCPFPVGHVEKFDSDKPISYAPKAIPSSMIGQYQAIIEFKFSEGGKDFLDCAKIEFEIAEYV